MECIQKSNPSKVDSELSVSELTDPYCFDWIENGSAWHVIYKVKYVCEFASWM